MKLFKKIILLFVVLLIVLVLASCFEDLGNNKIKEPSFDSCKEGNHSIDLWVEDGEYVLIYCSECDELIHKGKPNYDLVFTLNSETNEYYVSQAGKAAQNEVIIIPSSYDGLPVTGVKALYPDMSWGVDMEIYYAESQIKTVYIPPSVKYIGGFSTNDNLESVYISSGVEQIQERTFLNCDNLKNIYVSLSNKNYKVKDAVLYTKDGSKLIKYCAQNTAISFEISDGVKYILSDAFSNSQYLKSITLPSSLVYIESSAFSGCSALEAIEIPDGVKTIEAGAFRECTSLKSVSIGSGVEGIGRLTFNGCTSLENISVDSKNTSYLSYEGDLYTKEGTLLIQYALGSKEKTFTGRSTLSAIGEFAFSGAPYLEEVKRINTLKYINENAFYNCPSLKVISFGSSLQQINSNAFSGSTAIEEVHIPGLATWLSVKLNGLYSSPFCHAADLYIEGEIVENLVIPNSVSQIPQSAFMGCQSIKTVIIPKSVRTIGKSAFFGCNSIERVVIEDGVQSIYGSAFYGCSSLKEIIIPNSVAYIDNFAFCDCKSLESIVLPSQIRAINDSLFASCTALKSVTVPVSVKEIRSNAFLYCESLEEINYGGTIEEWNAIKGSIDYDLKGRVCVVNCTDGSIEIP